MSDNEIKVRIVGDSSELKQASEQGSVAVDRLKKAFTGVSGETNRAEMELARVSAHITGDAIPGFSRMSREIASLGVETLGAGTLLAAMIPVAALVGGIMIWNKYEEAVIAAKQAEIDITIETNKMEDSVAQLNEKIAGLEEGPLSQAKMEMKDFGEQASEVPGILKNLGKELDDNSSWWQRWADHAKNATQMVMQSQGLEMGSMLRMTDSDIENRSKDIIAMSEHKEQIDQAVKEMGTLINDVAAGGGSAAKANVSTLEETLAKLTALQAKYRAEATAKGDDVTQPYKTRMEAEKKLAELEKHNDEERKRAAEVAARAQAQAASLQARYAEDDARYYLKSEKDKEESLRSFDSLIKAVNQDDAQGLEDENREAIRGYEVRADLIRRMNDVKQPVSDLGKVQGYERQREALEQLMDAEQQELDATKQKAQLATGPEQKAYDKQILDLEQLLQKQGAMWDEYGQRINQAMSRSVAKVSDEFNTGVMTWLKGGMTFERSMTQAWMNIASSALSSLIKMGEAELAHYVEQQVLHKLEVMMHAKTAAAKSMTALPFPENIPLALASLAATVGFAAKGGIMSDDGGLIAHKNEMILPPHISQFVMKAAASQSDEGDNGGNHFHYTANVHAIDTNGMEDALKEHGSVMFDMWQQEARRRNLV